jgi:hypothetical protein
MESIKNKNKMTFILCCECEGLIPTKRILFQGVFAEEEIICGACIKKNNGQNTYQFWKSIFDEPIDFKKD